MSSRIKNEISRIVGKVNEKFMADNYPNLDPSVKGCMTGINFQWGHPLEIVRMLQLYTAHDDKKFEKFPVIMLYTDISVQKNKFGDYDGALLQLVIANSTSPTYTAAEREINNFIPVLRPLYEYFLYYLELSSVFNVENPLTDMKHTATERYYWGKTGLYGNTANMFNDFIDAIHIENLDLKLNIDC